MINTAELNDWIINNDIKRLSIKYFWEYVKMYTIEVDDEYSNTLKRMFLKLISLELYKASISTVFDLQQDIIEISLDIVYFGNSIGRFRIVYSVFAEYLDESLDLDDINYILRLTDVYEKTAEIVNKAINEGIDENVISKITGLSYEQMSLLISNVDV
ncbi:MAG: hypothetical protein ACK5JH_07795 [Anaerocolumna sp.]